MYLCRPVIGTQFIGAQAGKQCGEDEGAVTFDPIAASPRLRLSRPALVSYPVFREGNSPS
jgi:hypothetical protein